MESVIEQMFLTGGPFIASFIVFVTGTLVIGKWIILPVIRAASEISKEQREIAIAMLDSTRNVRESTTRLDHLINRLCESAK